MHPTPCIAGLFPEELSALLRQEGHEPYRARQILEWIFRKGVLDFDRMSDLPRDVRRQCAAHMRAVCLNVVDRQVSPRDATEKYVLRTAAGGSVETVFIPSGRRRTVCISTQIGCPLGCVFCASGACGCEGNVTAAEMVSQVLLVMSGRPDPKPTNIVCMGMGEPFLNYDATLKAVRILNHPACLAVAARKITISTCGMPAEILRLSEEGIQIELSISLHAADETLRSQLVPLNTKYPLSQIITAAKEYIRRTRRMITFEYVLLAGLNDREADAHRLVRLLRGIPCKVNLIPLNPGTTARYQPPSAAVARAFLRQVQRAGITVTLRQSRGADINGACGQLRLSHTESA